MLQTFLIILSVIILILIIALILFLVLRNNKHNNNCLRTEAYTLPPKPFMIRICTMTEKVKDPYKCDPKPFKWSPVQIEINDGWIKATQGTTTLINYEIKTAIGIIFEKSKGLTPKMISIYGLGSSSSSPGVPLIQIKNAILNPAFTLEELYNALSEQYGRFTPSTRQELDSAIFDYVREKKAGGIPKYPDINKWNVSKIKDMSRLFSGTYLRDFNEDISGWNVSNVTTMEGMFERATSFNNGGVPLNWDVSNVTNMKQMFREAKSFNQPIGNWDVSNVTDMTQMFYLAISFNQNLSNWNVGKVTNMFAMFEDALSFNNGAEIGDESPLLWGNKINKVIKNVHLMFAFTSEVFRGDKNKWEMDHLYNQWLSSYAKIKDNKLSRPFNIKNIEGWKFLCDPLHKNPPCYGLSVKKIIGIDTMFKTDLLNPKHNYCDDIVKVISCYKPPPDEIKNDTTSKGEIERGLWKDLTGKQGYIAYRK